MTPARVAPFHSETLTRCAPFAFVIALQCAAIIAQRVGFQDAAGFAQLAFVSVAPGLLVGGVGLLAKRHSAAWTWVLSLALSPGVVTGATAFLVFALGTSLDAAVTSTVRAAFGGACLMLGLALTRGASKSPAQDAPSQPGSGALLWLGFGSLVLLSILVQWAPGTRLSYHGLMHADYVAQISVGTIPPENPALAGEPLSYGWLYHWLLVVQHRLTGRSILFHSPILNVICLFVYLAACLRICRRFLPPTTAALAALAVGFAGNLAFGPALAWGSATAEWPEAGFYWPFQILSLGAMGGDPRLVTLLAKFWNMSGSALGFALWAVVCAEFLPIPERQPIQGRVPSRSEWGVGFVALLSLTLLHTATALAAFAGLAAGQAALLARDMLRRDGVAQLVRTHGPLLVVSCAAIAFAMPYLISVTSGSHMDARVGGSLWPIWRYGATGVFLTTCPLLIASIWGAVRVARTVSDETALFLTASTAALLLLGVVVPLPDNAQYKFPLVASLPGGLLLLWMVRESAPRLIPAFIVPMAVLAHVGSAWAYFAAGSRHTETYVGDGAFLSAPGSPELDAALRWLRNNTPADAVVVSVPVAYASSPITAVSGRGDLVLDGGQHTVGRAAYGERKGWVAELYSPDGYPGPWIAKMHEGVERPLYILVSRDQLDDRFEAVRAKLADTPEAVRSVHSSDNLSIFQVTLD